MHSGSNRSLSTHMDLLDQFPVGPAGPFDGFQSSPVAPEYSGPFAPYTVDNTPEPAAWIPYPGGAPFSGFSGSNASTTAPWAASWVQPPTQLQQETTIGHLEPTDPQQIEFELAPPPQQPQPRQYQQPQSRARLLEVSPSTQRGTSSGSSSLNASSVISHSCSDSTNTRVSPILLPRASRERGVKRERSYQPEETPSSPARRLSFTHLHASSIPSSPACDQTTPDGTHKKARHSRTLGGAPCSDPITTRTLTRTHLTRQGSAPASREPSTDTTSIASVSPLLTPFSRLSHRRVAKLSRSVSETGGDVSPSESSPVSSPSLGPQSSRKGTPSLSTKRRSIKREESLPPFRLSSCNPLPLPSESDGVVTGSGNGLAAGVTIPKAVPGKRGGGFSCHCCKTSKRNLDELFLCTNILPKTNSSAGISAARAATEAQMRGEVSHDAEDAVATKKCKKKYCLACMTRLYTRELQILRGQNEDQWTCPSCLNRCTCAGCERKVSGHSEAPWRRKKGKKDANTPPTTGKKRAPSTKVRVRRSSNSSGSKAPPERSIVHENEVPAEEEDQHEELDAQNDSVMEEEVQSRDTTHGSDNESEEDSDESDEAASGDDVASGDVIPSPCASLQQVDDGGMVSYASFGSASLPSTFHLPTTPNTTTIALDASGYSYPAHRQHYLAAPSQQQQQQQQQQPPMQQVQVHVHVQHASHSAYAPSASLPQYQYPLAASAQTSLAYEQHDAASYGPSSVDQKWLQLERSQQRVHDLLIQIEKQKEHHLLAQRHQLQQQQQHQQQQAAYQQR